MPYISALVLSKTPGKILLKVFWAALKMVSLTGRYFNARRKYPVEDVMKERRKQHLSLFRP